MKMISYKTFNIVSALLITLFLLAVLLPACEKKEKDIAENNCPVVAASLVPQAVKDSFAMRYPANTVITWFNKDSVAFCAYFMDASSVDKLAQFANDGNFIKEETEANHEDEHEDSTAISNGKISSGCECEVHQKGD